MKILFGICNYSHPTTPFILREVRARLSWRPLFALMVLSFLLAMTLGCGLTLRKDLALEGRGVSPKTPSESFSPEGEGGVDPEIHSSTKEEEEEEPIKVGLLLGPGGVKSFAHTGVIRELLKAQIPIDFVVGMEWGALIGGVFATEGQIHNTEWKLYKLQRKNLFQKKGFFGQKGEPISVGNLGEFMKSSFGQKKFHQMKVGFACPSVSLRSGAIRWRERGSLQRGVEYCWPYPPLFKPKGDWVAAPFALVESMEYLKNQGVGLIIFVNVMDVGDLFGPEQIKEDYKSSLIWQEVRRSLRDGEKYVSQNLGVEVIQVKTRKFKLYDFDKRQSLVLAGEQAGRQAVKRLLPKYGF